MLLTLLLSPLFSLLAGANANQEKPANGTDFDLYVLAGQSNMDGYGKVSELPEDHQGEVAGASIFHGNPATDASPRDRNGGQGHWARLRPGHGRGFSSTDEASKYSDAFGLELSFARALRKANPDRPLALIKDSRGGTTIDRRAAGGFGCWDPDFDAGSGAGKGINQYDHCTAKGFLFEGSGPNSTFGAVVFASEIVFRGARETATGFSTICAEEEGEPWGEGLAGGMIRSGARTASRSTSTAGRESMRRFTNSPISGQCWGPLAEILPPELRRRLVRFGDAEQSVWIAGGNEDERRDVVHWLHEHGRTHLGRLLELEADEIGETQEDWLSLRSVLRGPSSSGSDVSAVCIHDADRLSVGSQRLVLGALNELESCEASLGAPRLIATSAANPAEQAVSSEDMQHLLMRLDVLHFELPDPLAEFERVSAPAGGASTSFSTLPRHR